MQEPKIGCVPYLNAKPLIDWFHSGECDSDAKVSYAVPSELARGLETGELDVALVSTFELFKNPSLRLVQDISISADGPVKSVRLFSRVPFDQITSVALDTSSLTSTALVRILLSEMYGLSPRFVAHPPDISAMLRACDAGLLIGDLKLFDTPATHVLDLGEAWRSHTGLPFVYAAWLARDEMTAAAVACTLIRAKEWGVARLPELSVKWSQRLDLSLERVENYLQNVMIYGLDERLLAGLDLYREKCIRHGLVARDARNG
jgi:chorismate dehydratase